MAAPMRRSLSRHLFCQNKSEFLNRTCNTTESRMLKLNNLRMKSTGAPSRGGWRKILKYSLGGAAVGVGIGALVGLAGKLMPKTAIARESVQPTKYVKNSEGEEDGLGLKLTLFQFVTCPFCCKVRAYLDYHGINYNIVEVNSVTRKETGWTDYRKVPIVVCDGEGSQGFVQMNDSSLIMSLLESYIFDPSVSVEKFNTFYPAIKSKFKKRATFDYPNRYFIMYQENISDDRTPEERKEERKWRKWIDDNFVHVISPNVYRTLKESYRTFQWFSEHGDWEKVFDDKSRLTVIYSGAFVMYFVGKSLKKKYDLREDVRASLYDHCNAFVKGLKGRNFIGGDKPNLADLSMYGVLTSIEGTDAFQDMLNNCKIGPWYQRTKSAVENHEGAAKVLKCKSRAQQKVPVPS